MSSDEPKRRLFFDNVELVQAKQANRWHLPGGGTKSTNELIAAANERGVSVVLQDSSHRGVSTRRLN